VQHLVSIIMPVLNEAALITAAITAVGQQPGAHELIVVDGGSDDGTCAAVLRNTGAEVRLVQCPPGTTPDIGSQINLGATHARGDILMFLHCDVRLPVNAIPLVSRVFDNSGIIGGGFLPAFGGSVPAGERIPLRLVERVWQTRTRVRRWFVGDTAPFVRADLFKRSNGYPTSGFASDWDFAAKLRSLGPLAVITAPVRVDARRHVFNGVFKTLWVTGSVEFMYRLGVNRRFLRQWYRSRLPHERQAHASTVVSELAYRPQEEQ
jgi:glycosyltransferase involved in cell wall biosynthesis